MNSAPAHHPFQCRFKCMYPQCNVTYWLYWSNYIPSILLIWVTQPLRFCEQIHVFQVCVNLISSRYTFAHYIAFILATSGSYVSSYDPKESYSVYIFGLMIGASSLAFINILIMITRSIKDPLQYKLKYSEEDEKHLKLSNSNFAA